MSLPKFPDRDQSPSREEVINQIISSIAMEELGLSHIINAEGEKLQYALGTIPGVSAPEGPLTIDELLELNKSVHKTLDSTMLNQFFLKEKLSKALAATVMQGPTGPEGPAGPQGPATITIDPFVERLEPGESPYVNTDQGTEVDVVLQFGIPRGETGPQGEQGPVGPQGVIGPTGQQGDIGATGPQGDTGPTGTAGTTPAFGATATSLDPDDPATVNVDQTFPFNVELKFGIPKGRPGHDGAPGETGATGAVGETPAFTAAANTLEPGANATVGVDDEDPLNIALTFGIPRGYTGADGAPGAPGETPAFTATANTLEPGTTATVDVNSDDPLNIELSFGIPRGYTGAVGATPAFTATANTLEPGATATVNVDDEDPLNIELSFGIPRGYTGAVGATPAFSAEAETLEPEDPATVEVNSDDPLNIVLTFGIPKGEPGDTGGTPYIGGNGNWWVNGVDTTVPAQGDAATIAVDPEIQFPYDDLPHVINIGTPQEAVFKFEIPPGTSPHIDEATGHWWVGNADTGVTAQGPQGETGAPPTFAVEETQTLEPDEEATVDVREDPVLPDNWLFTFGIPKGESGLPESEDFTVGTAVGSNHDVRIGNVLYRLQRVAAGSLGMRLYLLSALPGQSFTVDYRKHSNYLTSASGGGSPQGAMQDGYLLTPTPVNLDDTIYMSSNEIHWFLLRQQDPVSLLWSLCEVRMFISSNAQRVSVWVYWISKDVSY